jgi:hypothetical protein
MAEIKNRVRRPGRHGPCVRERCMADINKRGLGRPGHRVERGRAAEIKGVHKRVACKMR